MKRSAFVLPLLLAATVFHFAAVAPAQEAPPASADLFAFNYPAGLLTTYNMDMTMSMKMKMRVGAESMDMKMAFTMRYAIGLTAEGEPKAGVSTVKLQPSNLEGEWDITGPGGRIEMSLRGSEMKGTQNGVVFIDTAKDIGTAQAQEFKKEITALYLSGKADLDARGNAKRFHGDMPFVEFWTDTLEQQVGFFGIVFPAKPVAVGESWTETLTLKKMGEITLEGEGLRCDAVFTRQPDTTVQGRRLATFNLSAPFNHKDLSGTMEQMGQSTRLNIASFQRTADGVIRFDREKGILTESVMKADATGSMNAMIQGQTLQMDLTMGMETKLSLPPAKP